MVTSYLSNLIEWPHYARYWPWMTDYRCWLAPWRWPELLTSYATLSKN